MFLCLDLMFLVNFGGKDTKKLRFYYHAS